MGEVLLPETATEAGEGAVHSLRSRTRLSKQEAGAQARASRMPVDQMKGFKDGAGYPMAGHYSTRRKPPHKNADNLTGSLADHMPRDDGNLIFQSPLQASHFSSGSCAFIQCLPGWPERSALN